MNTTAGPTLAPIPDATAEHGEVFTRRWVVNLVLDLAGYTADQELPNLVAVEPACGGGAFLGPMVARLSESCRRTGRTLSDAAGAIRAFDLLDRNVEESRRVVEKVLIEDDWPHDDAASAARTWVRKGDYLLQGQAEGEVDFVLGNPPYVRLESVPGNRMAAYRQKCSTMTGRADLYVGFFEIGLRSLRENGTLAFICADRWMRNQYGRLLRKMVSQGYNVETVISMHDVDAFDEQVSAYPAISVIRRSKQGPVIVVDTRRSFSEAAAARMMTWIRKSDSFSEETDSYSAARLPHWFTGEDSWPSSPPSRLALIEDLNNRFLPLEDRATGTRVGIGVATGADSVFITRDAPVEESRLLPLAMVRDIRSGRLIWSGNYLINPWDCDGNLVDLRDYPRLRRYLQRNADKLKQRYVASKRPSQWYRTIDKVDDSLTRRPKLLLPDLKLTTHPVLDEGGYYPHHNLYYIISDKWDLRILGGLLISGVAQAFMEAYAVRMRGGTLRFQAQYLRKIRVPHPDHISAEDGALLADAFDRRDTLAATDAAIRVYGIKGMGDLGLGSEGLRGSGS